MGNRLERKILEDITNQFIKDTNKYEIFKIPNEAYLDYFNKIEELFNSCYFDEDDRFVTYGRLNHLREELTDRLKDEKLKKEDVNFKNKWDNRLGAFWDLRDFIMGDRYITPFHVPKDQNFSSVIENNDNYYKDGIICKEEKDVLLEMINEMKNFINNNRDDSKKLLLKVTREDWGMKTIYTWSTKTWYIYDDLTVKYVIKNGQGKTKEYDHSISEEDLNTILQKIELSKNDNRIVEVLDGDAWEFALYDNDDAIWYRKLGYIYGIDSLESITNILSNLVKADSDIFIEYEGNGMESEKYDVNVEENVPQFVYGIPDDMRKQWKLEEQEEKYDVKPEENVPQFVYGIPDDMRKQWELEEQEEKYDVKPEENVPYEVYGIPDFKLKNYDVKPEDNVPQRVYGVPRANKTDVIRIAVSNSKSNYVVLLTHDLTLDTSDYVLADMMNLDGKTLDDIKIDISNKYFNRFKERVNNIIDGWNDEYPGDSDVKWKVSVDTPNGYRMIDGCGGFPGNWNKLMSFLTDSEIMYKQIRKMREEVKSNIDNKNSTFRDVVSNDIKDPFFVDLVCDYFIKEKEMTDVVAKVVYKDVAKYDDILNEFTKYLVQKTYDIPNAIEINGYTAKKISELNPSFAPSGVYSFLTLLRDDYEEAQNIINSGFKNKDVIPPTKNTEE